MIATHMRREAGEAADAIRRLLTQRSGELDQGAEWLAASLGPVTAAARGSSDHAVSAFKYVCEIATGRPVASIGPSIASVYRARLALADGLHLTVSQSGASPDIVALQAEAARGGARTVAIVNRPDSPLGLAADLVIPIEAGEEKSVAATKSYLASCAALFALVARAARDDALAAGLAALPDAMDALAEEPDAGIVGKIADAPSLFVSARGPAFGIALEAALKAKETAGIHAEAFSAAELMHGPLQLVQPGFPVVAMIAEDASTGGTLDALDRLSRLGGRVIAISTLDLSGLGLPAFRTPSTGHAATDALVFALAWYRIIETVARMRGLDPDRPANLRKVTETH